MSGCARGRAGRHPAGGGRQRGRRASCRRTAPPTTGDRGDPARRQPAGRASGERRDPGRRRHRRLPGPDARDARDSRAWPGGRGRPLSRPARRRASLTRPSSPWRWPSWARSPTRSRPASACVGWPSSTASARWRSGRPASPSWWRRRTGKRPSQPAATPSRSSRHGRPSGRPSASPTAASGWARRRATGHRRIGPAAGRPGGPRRARDAASGTRVGRRVRLRLSA